VADLLRWEGSSGTLYLDTMGLVTVGVGNYLRSVADACRLPFQHVKAGRKATAPEIERAYQAVAAMRPGMAPTAYLRDPELRLLPDAIDELLSRRLEIEFLPGLVRQFQTFEDFPAPAQRALVDMAYGLGLAGLAKFVHLMAAVRSRDWLQAAQECNRRTARDERNAWTKARFKEAAGLVGLTV
jgi:GH24 family phage-related lysozyme (muramidase)